MDNLDALRATVVRLEQRIELLEQEKEELLQANEELDEQNAVYMNFAVTFNRLYSTKDYVEVIAIIKEILINLIGAKQFEIHVLDKNKDSLILITREGKMISENAEAQYIIAQTLKRGELFIAAQDGSQREGTPVSCVPMKVDNEVLGVIVVNELLFQKKKIQPQDRVLFELLGKYASMAIYFSKLNWIFEAEIHRKLRDGTIDLTPPTLASMKSIVGVLKEKRKS